MSPFARTCQASHLLSHILRHLFEKSADVKFHYQEAIQLHRTINALKLAIEREFEDLGKDDQNWKLRAPLFPGMAICYSAQLTLYDAYMCTDVDDVRGIGIQEQMEMQQIAISCMKDTCLAVHQFANALSRVSELEGPSKVTPLSTDCLYQTNMLLLFHIRETGNREYVPALGDIMNALKMLGRWWDVASNKFRLRTF